MQYNHRMSAMAFGIGALLLAGRAHADQALIIGVNDYTGLPADAQLGGCVNDAAAMASALQKYGFKVKQMRDDQATRRAVLDALHEMQTKVGASERFIFFFAGHGSRMSDGKGSILPSDAQAVNEKFDITADELYQAVRAVPARSRTVLLDSCFSGSVARNVRSGKLKARYYNRRKGVREADAPQPVNQQDDPNTFLAGGSEVCYFVAARKNEMANEDDFDGVRSGYFTHYTVLRLNGNSDRWGDIQKDVTGSIEAVPNLYQHPCLSAPYAAVALFEPINGIKPEPAKNRTVWDNFNEDRSDPSVLTLEMAPNKSALVVNQDKFNLQVKAVREGYIAVMARDEHGELQLLYPKTRATKDCRMTAGQELKLPLNKPNYFVDVEGIQEFKAILFDSEDQAQALLDAFPVGLIIDSAKSARSRLVRESDGEKGYVSAGFAFQVVGADGKRKKP